MKENDGNNKWIDDRLAARLPDQEWQPDADQGLARFRERSDAKRPNRRRWVWIGAAALATSLALAAALSWVVPTYEPSSTLAAILGDLAVTVVAAALVALAWWRLGDRGRVASPTP